MPVDEPPGGDAVEDGSDAGLATRPEAEAMAPEDDREAPDDVMVEARAVDEVGGKDLLVGWRVDVFGCIQNDMRAMWAHDDPQGFAAQVKRSEDFKERSKQTCPRGRGRREHRHGPAHARFLARHWDDSDMHPL